MQRLLKKIILLMSIMVVSIFYAGTLHAANPILVSNATEFNDAFNQLKMTPGGGMIKLTGDVVLSSTVNLSSSPFSPVEIDTDKHAIILSLNADLMIGKHVKCTSSVDAVKPMIMLGRRAKLTIEKGAEVKRTIFSEAVIQVNEGGVLNVNGGEISSARSTLDIMSGGTANIKGGLIKTSYLTGVMVDKEGSLNMAGGVIEAEGASGVGISSYGKVYIEGASQIYGNQGITVASSSIVVIDGGYIVANTNIGYGVNISKGGSVTINGGTIKADQTSVYNQGTINLDNKGALETAKIGIHNVGSGTANISGGRITAIGQDTMGILAEDDSTIIMQGGKLLSSQTGISLKNDSSCVIYKGSIQAVSSSGIFFNGMQKALVYSAVEMTGGVSDKNNPRYKELESFKIVSPHDISLKSGEDKKIDFIVKGQKLSGDSITLEELLGSSGTFSYGSYKAVGNSITFTANKTGNTVLKVQDPFTFSDTADVSIKCEEAIHLVIGGNVGLKGVKIETNDPHDGIEGKTYSYTFKAIGGKSPYQFEVDEGSLPDGLILSKDGPLSGVSNKPGNYKFTVTVTDSMSISASHTFRLTIKEKADSAVGGTETGNRTTGNGAAVSNKVIILTIGTFEAGVDGKPYRLDAAAFIDKASNRTLVPIRFISEALDAEVLWDAKTEKIDIKDGNRQIILKVGTRKVSINGAATEIDCAPMVAPPGRTFVPLRFISEVLGADVKYDIVTKQITITK